jgi:hypothetical protein
MQGASKEHTAALAGGLPHISASASDTTDGDCGACGS